MIFRGRRLRELLVRLDQRLFGQLESRISKQVAANLESFERRLEEMLARIEQPISQLQARIEQPISQLEHRLSLDLPAKQAETIAALDHVAALAQRLDSDVVQGFANVVRRLETDLVQLAQASHRMDNTIAGIGPQIAGAVRSVGVGMTRDLTRKVDDVTALVQRLESDVVQGFSSVVRRLEPNPLALHETGHQPHSDVGGAVHDISNSESHLDDLYRDLPQPPEIAQDKLRLDFPGVIKEQFPDEFESAWTATRAVLDILPQMNLAGLDRHSPGLTAFDWSNYIHLSAIRLVRAGAMLHRAGLRKGRLLDFGSCFGNFALFARYLGFEVDAVDSYSAYNGAFTKSIQAMKDAGIRVIDTGHQPIDLSLAFDTQYDAILCMNVIEHVPHTPKPLLLALNRVLRPKGTLLLDTPNLLYLYNRERLAHGDSIYPAIEHQFDVEPPFEGHHRQYAPKEVVWMLEHIGHHVEELELFNYSIYGRSELQGKDVDFFLRMEVAAEYREYIMVRSTKPDAEPLHQGQGSSA